VKLRRRISRPHEALLDHLIGQREELRWDANAKGFGGAYGLCIAITDEEDSALARATEREAASIPSGQPDRRGAALLRGRIKVESLLDLGRRNQQRLSRG
jgi:hypothetical protein